MEKHRIIQKHIINNKPQTCTNWCLQWKELKLLDDIAHVKFMEIVNKQYDDIAKLKLMKVFNKFQ